MNHHLTPAAAILRIVCETVIEANDVGGVDLNDLVDRLAAAGYDLPDEDEPTAAEQRHTASTITDDALDRLYGEREQLLARVAELEARRRMVLPIIRRALDCLATTCRYHGDELDPDRFGLMTRSEACCDTGVEPRRRREATNALATLDTISESR